MASRRPMSYALRSQAFSPCRGSGPESPRRRSSPRARASRARSRSRRMSRITEPSSAGAAANRSIAASASATSLVGPAIEQCLHQNTRRWSAPRQQLSLADQVVDGGAHQRYRLVAISTPSLLPRHVHVDERSIAEVVCMACEHVADLGEERAVRGHAPQPCGGAPARRPAPSGRRPTPCHCRIVGQSVAHPRSRAPRDRRQPARHSVFPGSNPGDDRSVGQGVGAAGHVQAMAQVLAPSGTS